MEFVLTLIALATFTYGVPIDLYTGPTAATIPPVKCEDSCPARGPNFTGNIKHSDPRYYIACHKGVTQDCMLCDPKGNLHFNEFCNECRYPGDTDSKICLTYTGPTELPDGSCTVEDHAYASSFCKNLAKFPGYGSMYENKTGNFAYDIFTRNQGGSYVSIATIVNRFITCFEGVQGYCFNCPSKLVWRVKVNEENEQVKACGHCDYTAVEPTRKTATAK